MAFIDLDKIINIDEITDIQELRSLQVDTDDIFGEMADEILIREYDDRELESESYADYISELPSYKLKDLFCDLVGVNHHTSKGDILKLIAEKI